MERGHQSLALFFLSLLAISYSVPVYVMLPLDIVNPSNPSVLQNQDQLKSWFQQLKSIGVAGLMGDFWWGIIENAGPKQYNWDAYKQLLSVVQDSGLKIQVILSFHKCGTNHDDACDIPLPQWVGKIAQNNISIYYRDQWGHDDNEYLSLGVDDLPLFQGRTAIELYAGVFDSFNANFASFKDIITDVEIGLGPAGEMRYPGYQLDRWTFPGLGAFQSFDPNMLAMQKAAAMAAGKPEWYSYPPGNAGSYNSAPQNTEFFTHSSNVIGLDNKRKAFDGQCYPNSTSRTDCGFVGITQQQCEQKGCCWSPFSSKARDTPWCFTKSGPPPAPVPTVNNSTMFDDYGNFYLTWYSQALIDHGDKILAQAEISLPGYQLVAKVSGIHWLVKTESHAAELTTGYYNTGTRDGYLPIAQMFKKHNTVFDFTCFEMLDSEQCSSCGPEELVAQTKKAAATAGIPYDGENALNRYDTQGLNTIVRNSQGGGVRAFTYLRLGSDLMGGGNFQNFKTFVQNMNNINY